MTTITRRKTPGTTVTLMQEITRLREILARIRDEAVPGSVIDRLAAGGLLGKRLAREAATEMNGIFADWTTPAIIEAYEGKDLPPMLPAGGET